jgi:flagellar hook protein FlgE
MVRDPATDAILYTRTGNFTLDARQFGERTGLIVQG